MLTGKRVAITGAAQGIGEAAARAMAARGAKVLLADIDFAKAESVAGELVAEGAEAIALEVDVTVAADTIAMVETAVSAWGGLDVLVNSAGILVRLSVPDTPEEVWNRVMAINVNGTFLASKAAIPVMERQKDGVVINVASGASFVGNKGLAAYGASKGAILILTKCMAADHAASNIRVNCICPGVIDSELNRSWMRDSGDFEAAYAGEASRTPLGRLGTTKEVGEMIAFMASDACSFMTGTPILQDGGLTLFGSRNA